MERVLLHKNKTPGGPPRIERVTDPQLVFCGCVEEITARTSPRTIAIVRGEGCELCEGRGVVTAELAAMYVGALLELEEVGT